MVKNKKEKIYIGGWFQRTVLHLREIFNFLKTGISPLKSLDSEKLKDHLEGLEIEDVAMIVDTLTYLSFSTKKGICVKIFEDGLVVLKKEVGADIGEDMKDMAAYYEYVLSPALNYLFELGMPLPKRLIGSKIVSPFFVILNKSKEGEALDFLKRVKEENKLKIKNKNFEIYRGDKFYVINNISEDILNIEKFINEEIFIREFISQMHRYLNLHRVVWEKIDNLKEQGGVRGKEVQELKNIIEGYAKKVDLIEARIRQMRLSVGRRGKIAKSDKGFHDLMKALEFKYSALDDVLGYVEEIWATTKDYVDSTNRILEKIRSESTEYSLKSLSVITSIGVFASLINLSTTGEAPKFSSFGLIYIVSLFVVGYITNKIMIAISMNKSYKIKNVKIPKDEE